jgi:hypothetical protein
LTSVSSQQVATIGNGAFSNCTALISVNVSRATTIGQHAFSQCTVLASVNIQKATTIGFQAFFNCAALTSVTIHRALTLENFDNADFARSDNKIVWTLEEVGSKWTTRDFGKILIYHVNSQNEITAYYHTASSTAVIPYDIPNIGQYAFYGSDLTTLGIELNTPSYHAVPVTSIGEGSFERCAGLARIFLGPTPPTLGIRIFGFSVNSTPITVTVYIPASAKQAYGVPDLPTTNFNNSNTTANNWGNAFRGKGWDGTNYGIGSVNNKITLVFQTY